MEVDVDKFVEEQNVKRFQGLLQSTDEPAKRDLISSLLAEAEARLRHKQKASEAERDPIGAPPRDQSPGRQTDRSR